MTLALVLRRHDYGETSQTARLYTETHGRLSVLAKGIKRPNPTLRGPMDLFALAEVDLRIRQSSDLHLLTAFRVVTGFHGLRRNLERLWGAFYVTEILREGTRDLDPDPGLFALARDALTALDACPPPGAALVCAWFELGWLELGGFSPRFDACVTCDRQPSERGQVRFSPYLGGLVCRTCLARRSVHTQVVAQETREALLALLTSDGPAAASRLDVSAPARRSLREILPGMIQGIMEKELRAAAFVTP